MSGRRVRRLNEQLKREISAVIRKEVRDPRVGPITVTGVETAADLSVARVYVRSLGSHVEAAEVSGKGQETDAWLEGLEAAAPHIRHTLGKTLPLRRIPELRFEEDETLDRAMRIESILDEVRPEGGWEEVGDQEDEGAAGVEDDLEDDA